MRAKNYLCTKITPVLCADLQKAEDDLLSSRPYHMLIMLNLKIPFLCYAAHFLKRFKMPMKGLFARIGIYGITTLALQKPLKKRLKQWLKKPELFPFEGNNSFFHPLTRRGCLSCCPVLFFTLKKLTNNEHKNTAQTFVHAVFFI